jgi:hypothetical protein
MRTRFGWCGICLPEVMRPRRRAGASAVVTLALLLVVVAFLAPATAATLPYTMSLPCGQGAGLVGTYWISLPTGNPQINGTPIATAEDLCATIPNAISVRQSLPASAGGGTTAARDWTYNCQTSACTPAALSPAPPESGACCGSCFCVQPGEGYEVVVSAASSFTVSGSDVPDLLRLAAGSLSFLISIPFDACPINANDLSVVLGMPQTGGLRGNIQALDGCTGAVASVPSGTAAAISLTLQAGMAYRVRFPITTPPPRAYFNPVNGDFDGDGVASCSDNCPTVVNPLQTNSDSDPRGDACDLCPGVSDPAQVDTDGDGRGDICDNCPLSPNFNQTDGDIDLRGDVCDNCPGNNNPGQSDVDRDGFGDACDVCAGGGSRNVAIVDSVSCANGGALPTSGVGETGSLATYSYFNLAVGSVTAAQLGPNGACGASGCDTVLLNVCSAGMACTTAGLLPAEKTDLGAFVGSGHKLIIYDSECPGVDYSWLPIPFTSAPLNTAAGVGTVSVVEENSLSSSQPTESRFINTSSLGGVCTSDQVQSANALHTQNAGWCADMRATKGVSGPVHLYASYGADVFHVGLIIYNGLDLDASCGDVPGTLTGCQNFSKIWLQELQQPVDPSCLPCEQHVVSCDDQNPCTDDVFNPFNGGCTHTPNTNPCDDGNACTTGDTCSFNNCYGGTPVTCTASDQCHVAGVCDTSTGICSNPAAPNGTACTDNNACTQTDTCQAGACTGANPVVCTPLDQCHIAGVCDTGTGTCTNPAAPNGTTCTDNNACTQTDTCQAGACTGANPVVCTPLDQCHVAGVCDTGTGLCSNPAAPDGTACNDGDPCTHSDACQSGVCIGSHEDICNCLDDNCNGTVDEDCLVKVGGGPQFPIPGGTLSSGFSAYRLVAGAPLGGITTTESINGTSALKVKSTLIQTLCASGNTAVFTGTCVYGPKYPLTTTPCTFSATVVDGVLDQFTFAAPEPPAQYGPAMLPPQSMSIIYQ